MQLGPFSWFVLKLKIKGESNIRTNHSTCCCKLCRFWLIAVECKVLFQLGSQFFLHNNNCKISLSELQEVFLIEFVEESTTMLHVFEWSFINRDNNSDAWHRQFQTRLSHLLHQAPLSAGFAATSNPRRWLLRWCCLSCHNRLLAAARLEATLLCPLHHCPATAVN